MQPNRVRTLIAAVAVAMLVPAVALADGGEERRPAAAAGKKGDKPSFPMAGDAFTARIEARLKKMQARLEKRLDKRQASEEVKREKRAAFTSAAAKIRAAANKVAADGTVTAAEAKEVRAVMRELRGGKGKHKARGKGDKRAARGARHGG
jgi:hypothetical protein